MHTRLISLEACHSVQRVFHPQVWHNLCCVPMPRILTKWLNLQYQLFCSNLIPSGSSLAHTYLGVNPIDNNEMCSLACPIRMFTKYCVFSPNFLLYNTVTGKRPPLFAENIKREKKKSKNHSTSNVPFRNSDLFIIIY